MESQQQQVIIYISIQFHLLYFYYKSYEEKRLWSETFEKSTHMAEKVFLLVDEVYQNSSSPLWGFLLKKIEIYLHHRSWESKNEFIPTVPIENRTALNSIR